MKITKVTRFTCNRSRTFLLSQMKMHVIDIVIFASEKVFYSLKILFLILKEVQGKISENYVL